MNNNDKVFQYDEIRDTSRVRERDENSERMLRKTNHEIKTSNKKAEKNDRENEEHD